MKRGMVGVLERQPQLEGLGAGEWFTPDSLFREIETKYGPFTLDAAADPSNAKCQEYLTKEQDALSVPWSGRVWCNPPYTKILNWVKKAFDETQRGGADIVVLLLPAHTSTAWFHDYALPHGELYWVRGKRKFGGCKQTSIMPSLVVVFRRPEAAS